MHISIQINVLFFIRNLFICLASSQTNTLSPVDWGSGAFLPWQWRCRRGAADSGGRRQEHQTAAV